jgi:nucleoside 2-deoxyribosyltransferase
MNDDGLFVFVLMPFDTIFDDIYKLGIKESATNLGLRAERVDEQKYSEGVLDRIYRQIDLADIIIADMTGQNPNVFYEVGYAHAKEKLCILLTSSANDIPFDLKHRRHIVYEQSISKLKAQLSEDLIWARNIIKDTQKSHIQVNIKKPSGVVEKDRWTATGRVDFKIVLSNESTKPSPEIEAAYFYSTKDWSLFQDGNECPSTDSDIPEFNKQHFLKLLDSAKFSL